MNQGVLMKLPFSATVCALPIFLLAACAATPPAAPDNLKVPAGQTLTLSAQGVGVQIYECRAAKDDAKRFEWALKAPEAILYNSAGEKIGKHYGGPTWESDDGSKVVGEVKARDNGPDATAIPWLLLAAKSNSGSGVFGKTRSIQRLQTVGGPAPAGGCTVGQETRVDYKAAYYFYDAAS
jgi:hypothetical protein